MAFAATIPCPAWVPSIASWGTTSTLKWVLPRIRIPADWLKPKEQRRWHGRGRFWSPTSWTLVRPWHLRWKSSRPRHRAVAGHWRELVPRRGRLSIVCLVGYKLLTGRLFPLNSVPRSLMVVCAPVHHGLNTLPWYRVVEKSSDDRFHCSPWSASCRKVWLVLLIIIVYCLLKSLMVDHCLFYHISLYILKI